MRLIYFTACSLNMTQLYIESFTFFHMDGLKEQKRVLRIGSMDLGLKKYEIGFKSASKCVFRFAYNLIC